MNDATIDGSAEGRKFPFVFGLNVIDEIVGVEIKSNIIDGEIEQSELLKGIIEERAVIGFEMQFTVGLDDATIFIEEINIGQTAFRVFISWPRVAKINVDAVDLIIGKNIIDIGYVEGGDANIFEIEIADFASGGVKHGRFGFEPDEIYIGILVCDG